MKKVFVIIFSMAPALWLPAQQSSVPNVDLRDINGKLVSASNVIDSGKATLLVCWNPANSESSKNLDQIEESWETTLKQKNIRLVVICVDCNGNWSQVKPIVDGNDWDFDTYVDVNGDLKRAMNIGEGPSTLFFGTDLELLCRYSSSCTGSEEYLCESILSQLSNNETAGNFDPVK